MSDTSTTLADALLALVPDGTTPETIPEAGRARRRRAADLVHAHLRDLWAADAGVDERPGLALGLVGSHARGEGGPLSDLDVVILHDPAHVTDREAEDVARRLVTHLWDSGVGVDHSLRTPAQCRAIAAEDLAALTGLLDLTPVAGDAELVTRVRTLVGEDLRRNAPQRLAELLDGTRQRWESAGDLDLLNEPDLKNARGGLRDLDLLRALAAAWLADYPHDRVEEAAALLCDVRDALHLVSGRHTTVLLRVHQDAVARRLGLVDDGATALLRRLADAGAEISWAVQAAVARAEEARSSWGKGGLRRRLMTLRPRSPRRTGPERPDFDEVAPGVVRAGASLSLARPADARTTSGVLGLALASARTRIPMSSATLDDVTEAAWSGAIVEGESFGAGESAAFADLLAQHEGLLDVWFALDHTGVLTRWIPEWEALRSRPQVAAFHRWTVDRHSVGAVVETGRLFARLDEDGRAARPVSIVTDDPVPVDLAHLPRTTALLAALVHDIGKRADGLGEDHAHVGADLVDGVLTRLGFASHVPTVSLLVRHHLLLAKAATSMDPEDEGTVRLVLDAVDGDARTLSLLHVLTRADSVAAGPKAWTPWRARLIDDLTRRCLARVGA